MPTGYVRESAIGDGNCAFNAFILGLCQRDTLDRIEKVMQSEKKEIDEALSKFIEQASESLGVLPANFVTLKEELLRLRDVDPRKLQKTLAPIMRNLACDLLEKPPYGPESLEQSLFSAYDGFVNPDARGIVRDDVFSAHQFIKSKFEKLNEKYPIPESSEETSKLDRWWKRVTSQLKNWWKNVGYKKFVNEMRTNAEHSGDIELAPLACYFRLNLQVTRQDRFTHTMYRDCGTLPTSFLREQKEHVIEDLYNRGIIDPPVNEQQKQLPLNLNQEALARRLAAIPDLDTVLEYIEQQPEKMKGIDVPSTWSSECVTELKERGIIVTTKNGVDVLNMDKKAAIHGCNALPHPICNAILQHTKKEPLPEVLLVNDHALHWDFLNTNTAKKEENKIIKKEIIKYEEELLILLKEKLADYKGEGSKWEKWVKEQIEILEKNTVPLLQENTHPAPGEVEYTLSKDKKTTVTIEEQIKLDEAYAKKLQSEEYEDKLEDERPKYSR